MVAVLDESSRWVARSLQPWILAQEEQDYIDGVADSVSHNGNGEVATTGEINPSQNQPVRTLLDDAGQALAIMSKAEDHASQ
jgi:hypothetical protein